jgi:hypothetical protein
MAGDLTPAGDLSGRIDLGDSSNQPIPAPRKIDIPACQPRLRGMPSIAWAPQARFDGEINIGPVNFSGFGSLSRASNMITSPNRRQRVRLWSAVASQRSAPASATVSDGSAARSIGRLSNPDSKLLDPVPQTALADPQ